MGVRACVGAGAGACVGARAGMGTGGHEDLPRMPGSLGGGEDPPPGCVCVKRLWPRLFRGHSCERVSEAVIPFVSVSVKGSCDQRVPGVDVV